MNFDCRANRNMPFLSIVLTIGGYKWQKKKAPDALCQGRRR